MSNAKRNDDQQDGQEQNMQDVFKVQNPAELGKAIMNAYEKAQVLFEDYAAKTKFDGEVKKLSSIDFDPMNVQESYMSFLENIAQDPSKFLETQAEYAQDWMNLWQQSMGKLMGNAANTSIEPEKGDRRFKAEEWQENALFDFIKQSYLLTCRHLEKTVEDTDGLDKKQKNKLQFQTKLFTDAMSPSNFLLSNPEVLNETMRTGGDNLVKGFKNLIEDLKRGDGSLNIRTTDDKSFELGKNIAMSEGSVIYQNDMIQLIQYAPTTKSVNKTPLLIVPPWINKYYILDLREGNSMVEWAVAQGHTTFIISWVNPDKKLSDKSFEAYMDEGLLAALGEIEKITGEAQTNVMGYCLGGTLLAITLSYLTQKKQDGRIASATFLTTLLDFEHAGDMKLFLDDGQIDKLDKLMDKHGILQGKEMQKTFSMMRANDLIWSFVVNNYLMGREPFPFDLLYWNDDCTNMPAAMHRFYLRNMYRDNKLIEAGGISIHGTPIDLSIVKTPCHFISAKDDHIAPWEATYEGVSLLGSDNITFTLSASGHIAGVVNPPHKNKYCYWSNSSLPKDADKWFDSAKQHDGSWWSQWDKWTGDFSGGKVDARNVGKGIEPAPGSYVRVRG